VKSKHNVCSLASPTTRSCEPVIDRSKRSLVAAMLLDVVYSPRFEVKPSKYPNSRVKKYQVLIQSPVWKTAPADAARRATKLSSLLRFVTCFGWRCPSKPLIGRLTRLAINVWRMSKKDFNGLCHSITCFIRDSVRKQIPEPEVHFGMLTSLPYFTVEKFLYPKGKHESKARFRPTSLVRVGAATWLYFFRRKKRRVAP